jgi:stage III sporulation protein AG
MEPLGQIKSKKMLIPAICLLLGIMFLFVSEYIGTNGNKTGNDFDEEEYALRLEARLSQLLETMEGVSQVKVMVTLESGEEYRFASQSVTSSDSFFYLPSGSGSQEPILTTVGTPKIKGVSVVCKGASDIRIQKKIIELVGSTLNLSQNQIFVTE